MKKLISALVVVGGLSLGTGCHTMRNSSSTDQSQDRQLKQLSVSSRETNRNLEQIKQEFAQQMNALHQQMNEGTEKMQSLQRQINYIHRQNQTQADELKELANNLKLENQQRQHAINQLIASVGEQSTRLASYQNSHRQSVSRQAKYSKEPAQEGEFYKYKVEPGATLSAIAKAYKVSVKEIKAANKLQNNLIRVGQILYIPKH